ncbi:MAG: hypothetical protein M3083_02805 [Actinomycetota bacterium]|nr:hypothetical protein [Actinomycetota bacterium]
MLPGHRCGKRGRSGEGPVLGPDKRTLSRPRPRRLQSSNFESARREPRMELRFVPVNALIALCSQTVTSWPRTMFDAGYRLAALEFPAIGADGGKVTVDTVAWATERHRFVLGEAKSGANVEPVQAQRYATADVNDLVRKVGVTVTTAGNLTAQPVYACLRDNEDRILLGLTGAGLDLPVLSIGDNDVRHVGSEFDDGALSAAFAAPIPINGPPPGIITIDLESPAEAFDSVVRAALVALAAREVESATTDVIASEAIPHFAYYPLGYRNSLVRKIDLAARQAAAAAPDVFTYTPPTRTRGIGMIGIRNGPETLDPRGRTQRYQALAGRFTPAGRPPKDPGGQMALNLGDGADLERELAEAERVDDDGEEVNREP